MKIKKLVVSQNKKNYFILLLFCVMFEQFLLIQLMGGFSILVNIFAINFHFDLLVNQLILQYIRYLCIKKMTKRFLSNNLIFRTKYLNLNSFFFAFLLQIDHKNQSLITLTKFFYCVYYIGFGTLQFDHLNQMITLSMIILNTLHSTIWIGQVAVA